jgi:hypothetical protein
MPRKYKIAGREYTLGPDVDLDREVVLDGRGQRITEADAQRLAQEALGQVGRGRPSLTAPGEHSPQIKVRVPAELREELRATARREGKSPSQVVREALEMHLERVGRAT